MHIADGPPCENAFALHALDPDAVARAAE
jgi:hypothetical protein